MAKAVPGVPPCGARGLKEKRQPCKGKENGCTLLDLCPDDKTKVAKLIHQVVDLGKDLSQYKAKAAQDLQERTQHLRQRNAAVSQENHMLKAKLTHAFTLLRTYQHKVQALEAAAAPAESLHATQAATDEPQPKSKMYNSMQHRLELAAIRPDGPNSQIAGAHNHALSHKQHQAQQREKSGSPPNAKASKHLRCQHGTSQTASRQRPQHEASHQHTHAQQSSARHSQPGPSKAGGVFADLAAQTLAWQQDADTDSANLPAADPTDGKVLRFDPTLGADGGFYFVSWNSSQSQQQVAGTEGATLPSQLEHGQQLQWEQQTSTCPTDAPPFVKIQPQKEQQPCTLSVSQQLAQLRPAPGSDNADTTHARTVPADTCLQTGAAPSTAHAARDDVQLHTVALPGLSGLQAIAAAGVHPSAAAVGPSAATTAVAAVPFPIEGGGEAGRLLRAAAAAASGCSHELVVAAAGPCDVERARSQEPACEQPGAAPSGKSEHEAAPQQSFSTSREPQPSSVPAADGTALSQAQQQSVLGSLPGFLIAPSAQISIPAQLAASSTQSAALSPTHLAGPSAQPVIPGPLPAISHGPTQPVATPADAQLLGVATDSAVTTSTAAQPPMQETRVEDCSQAELGFDSSLMDLVAEVEQMVGSNMHTSQAALQSSNSLLSSPASTSRSQACHQQAAAQQPAWQLASAGIQAGGCEGLFEENDVISMISDQEYGAYQQY